MLTRQLKAQAVLIYKAPNGVPTQRHIFMDLAGLYTFVKTIKWCWYNDIGIEIRYIPTDDELREQYESKQRQVHNEEV